MKLPPLNYIFTLSTLLLCIIHSISCVPIGPSVSPDEKRDIETCISTCQVFRESFYNFMKQLDDNNWNEAKKDFSTCQYRCYKCAMNQAITAMNIIEEYKSNFTNSESRYIVKNLEQPLVIQSIAVCRDAWKVAATLNCDKTPVEDAVNFYLNDCA